MKAISTIRGYLYPVEGTRTHLPCTVAIPTRRRCPEPLAQTRHNPLCQCLDSILAQRSLPRQVLIASATAQDNTQEAVENYRRAFASKGVEFSVLAHPDEEALGPFGKIARSLASVRHDVVHMVEDDVFLHPDAVAGGCELMERLRVALLLLPVYRRATRPTKFLSFRKIGQLNNALRLTGCFESVFPSELLKRATGDARYPQRDGVLAHPIDFFRGGNLVISRRALEAIRNIPLGTPYGWEVCAGLHLKEDQFDLLSIPYINLAGMHSSYGARWGRKTLLGDDWTNAMPNYAGLSLSEIVANAVAGKNNTGLGPLHLHVYYFRVATCYALILQRYAPAYFVPWLTAFRTRFVHKVHSDFTAGRQKVMEESIRESIFLAALHAIIDNQAWLPNVEVLQQVASYTALRHCERQARTQRALRQADGSVAHRVTIPVPVPV
ncbi:MAG: glycosyltransferase family 2 protein [Verrucomicrobiales bacterium]|nr:glycosyltransferase family 2 protein [Verrucomicrobiales bacterium]